jgi:hypothetical protein
MYHSTHLVSVMSSVPLPDPIAEGLQAAAGAPVGAPGELPSVVLRFPEFHELVEPVRHAFVLGGLLLHPLRAIFPDLVVGTDEALPHGRMELLLRGSALVSEDLLDHAPVASRVYVVALVLGVAGTIFELLQDPVIAGGLGLAELVGKPLVGSLIGGFLGRRAIEAQVTLRLAWSG